MNYELAKQLKDAGFPQNGRGRQVHDWVSDPKNGFHYYEPTFEELADACGKDFTVLVRGLEGWYADSELGSTPKEAIANLWLALNEKPI